MDGNESRFLINKNNFSLFFSEPIKTQTFIDSRKTKQFLFDSQMIASFGVKKKK